MTVEQKRRRISKSMIVLLVIAVILIAGGGGYFWMWGYPAMQVERAVRNCDAIYLRFSYSEELRFNLLLTDEPERIAKKFKISKFNRGMSKYAHWFALIFKKDGKTCGAIIFRTKDIMETRGEFPDGEFKLDGADFYKNLVELGMPPLKTDPQKYGEMYKDDFQKSFINGARIPLRNNKIWIRGK